MVLRRGKSSEARDEQLDIFERRFLVFLEIEAEPAGGEGAVALRLFAGDQCRELEYAVAMGLLERNPTAREGACGCAGASSRHSEGCRRVRIHRSSSLPREAATSTERSSAIANGRTPALRAAGIEHRRVYACRHTFASWAIAGGVQLFYLARIMGTSIAQIDATYGHLLPDSEDYLRGLLDEYDGVRGLSVDLAAR